MIRIAILSLLVISLLLPTVSARDDETPGGVSKVSSSALFTCRAPGQLTTLFASNNGYAGNMFDLEPLVDLTEITAIDVNVDPAGVTAEVDVWYRMDTCVGHDLDPAGWMLLGHSTGTAAGVDLPTFIDLSGNGVVFPAGGTYGIYVDVSSYPDPGINYTNAPGPQTYANADASVTCYYGKATPAFTGSTFATRVWNGTIYYGCGPLPTLSVYPDDVSAWYGGTATFKLNGGPDMANRMYGLLGSVSGTLPGTPLPGGLVLPLNWDWFTETVLTLALMGSPMTTNFIGALDADGHAEATLWLPGHCVFYVPLLSNFAWCGVSPFDFVSEPVELTIRSYPGG